MENAISNQPIDEQSGTAQLKQYLAWGIKVWIALVFAGQWTFALYIAAMFGLPFVTGQIDESQFSHMIEGYVNGDTFGNAMLLVHILPVFVIALTAPLQLVPIIRQRFPRFHKLNGRVFLIIGFMGALTGLYLTWLRGTRFSDFGAMGITINGFLIPVAVYFAWRFAVLKKFTLHRRFAVHAFILINGVWTLRLYLMGWFMVNQGGFGNTATMDGPADIALSYACYMLPMLAAEIVFWAERQTSRVALLTGVISLAAISVITAIGVVSASMMMWWPRISAAF